MDSEKRSYSCRLTVHDSGRVRWCIGNERAWRTKLKLLVFLPIFLLMVTIIIIAANHFLATGASAQEINVKSVFLPYKWPTTTEEKKNGITTVQYAKQNETTNARNKRGTDQRKQFSLIESFYYPYESLEKENQTLVTDDQSLETDELSLETDELSLETDYLSLQIDDLLLETDNLSLDFYTNEMTKKEVRKAQAILMKNYMDETVDPCSDFYSYACGNWAKYNPIPPDKDELNTISLVTANIHFVLKKLLEEDLNKDDLTPTNDMSIAPEKYKPFTKNNTREKGQLYAVDVPDILSNTDIFSGDIFFQINDAIVKAKLLYSSCMNLDILEKRGNQPLLELLKYLGGWPIITPNWDESSFDWLWLVGQLKLYNNDILISQWVGPDEKNEYIIQIGKTHLGLPTSDHFLDTSNFKYLEAYKSFMLKVVILLGAPLSKAFKEVEDIIDFETSLAKIVKSATDKTEKPVRLPIMRLYFYIPQINWLMYFKIVTNNRISPLQNVICLSLKYMQNLAALLSRTPSRIISNYLLWRFVSEQINTLGSNFQKANQRFLQDLFDYEKAPPRWEFCVSEVNSNMGMALGNMFIRKFFDEHSKSDALQMIKEIQQEFREILVITPWLDGNTKNLSRYKVDAMNYEVGYPDFILNRHQLDEIYSDVNIHPALYFENNLSILRHVTKVDQERIGTSVNKNMQHKAPTVVNAYYYPNKNQITVPAAILQPPFYQKHFPRALNYGGIGTIIGHELTHGFDNKGRHFDKEGKFRQWWTNSATRNFEHRSSCLINQYNSYKIPGLNLTVDGKYTEAENIADNGGVKEAYMAYEKWLSKNKDTEETLPYINLNGKQLFFLKFAQNWCGAARLKPASDEIEISDHSPGRFRVIGSLSNLQQFSDAYKCPKGSPMNPVKKCCVW